MNYSLLKGNIRYLWLCGVIGIFLIFFNTTNVFAQNGDGNGVTWKTFNDRDRLFTINYPSNWYPSSVPEPLGPIDIDFFYKGKEYAWINIFARESIFTNVSDVMDSWSYEAESNYELERTVECQKYTINGEPACSRIVSYKDPDTNPDTNSGYLAVLTVIAIDNNKGLEYIFTFMASLDVFKTFLPVAEYMVESFKVTGNIPVSITTDTTGIPEVGTNQGMTGAEFSIEDESVGNNITSNIPQNNSNMTQTIIPNTSSLNNLTGADFSIN
jgi:hypothetical protein